LERPPRPRRHVVEVLLQEGVQSARRGGHREAAGTARVALTLSDPRRPCGAPAPTPRFGTAEVRSRAMDREPLTSQHVQLALRGGGTSLDWIVTRFSPLLKAQAAWRLGAKLRSQVDPDDVVAEAWLIVFRRLSDLDRGGGRTTPRLLAFLGTTILNIVN